MIEAIGTLIGLLIVAGCIVLAIIGGGWLGWNITNTLTGGELKRITGGK